jgi:hypothetical protein
MGPFNLTNVISNTVSMVALTVIWTSVFIHTRGSILMAILLHAASNASGNFFAELFPALPAQFGTTIFVLYIASALLIIVGTRGRLGYAQPGVEARP